MKTEAPLLEIKNLCLSYFTRTDEIPAVINFSLSIKAGECVGLVGESGCGKSTIAMGIMRYMGSNGNIVGGTVRYKGRDMASFSRRELRRLRGAEIAMVYQEPMAALNPSLTIETQLIEVPMYREGISATEARRRAIETLEDVRLPDAELILKKYPHQLSGGQQQRIVIAMALLSNPALLLLDEPTTALDVTVEAGIISLIAELSKKYGTALLYISHNLGLILKVCDRVCVMYSGEVIEQGSVTEVFNAPRHPYTHGLFDCIPLPSANKITRPLVPIRGQSPLPHQRPEGCNFGPRCDHFQPDLCDRDSIHLEPIDGDHLGRCVRWQDLRWSEKDYATEAAPTAPAGEEILHVKNLQKYYPVHNHSIGAAIFSKGVRYVKANETLTFSARRQETVAIVGESGCGKSTLAKVLMGLETATDGNICFNGEEISHQPVQKRTARQLGSLQMIFQNPDETLNPSISVGGHIARVIRKFSVEIEPAKIEERVNQLLDLVKLPREFASLRPRQLSGGQKQRVGIARAFAGNPAMVVADEPISALDVSVQAAVTQLLMDIQREHGTTILFISHDLSVVRYLADRIIVMYLGKIMESGTTSEIFSPPYHPYTEALLSAIPIADPKIQKRHIILEGALPSVLEPPKGCPFHTRCPRKLGTICEREAPPVQRLTKEHSIACHIPLEVLNRSEAVIQNAS